MTSFFDSTGILRTGKSLGHGGQAESVFVLENRVDRVFKKYKPEKTSTDQIKKLQIMVDHPPKKIVENVDGRTLPRLAWPISIVTDSYSNSVGFTMPEINKADVIAIEALSDKSAQDRAVKGGQTWVGQMQLGYRSVAALNLSKIVRDLHLQKYVIGDFNPSNIYIFRNANTCIVDCDSFQVTDLKTKKVYPTPVWVDHFTAPEAQFPSKNYVRKPEEDYFVLAIHIFRLIFQRRPFGDGHKRGGVNYSTVELMKMGEWRGKRGGIVSEQDDSLKVAKFLPRSTYEMFDRAFSGGPSNPHSRPTAQEWANELKGFIGDWRPHK